MCLFFNKNLFYDLFNFQICNLLQKLKVRKFIENCKFQNQSGLVAERSVLICILESENIRSTSLLLWAYKDASQAVPFLSRSGLGQFEILFLVSRRVLHIPEVISHQSSLASNHSDSYLNESRMVPGVL